MSLLLEATDVHFRYGSAEPALRGVSLRLFAGVITALIGPNGSGKSTLIKALIGALRAGSGAIRWDGKPLGKWSRRALARHIAYLSQSPLHEPGQRVIDALRLGRAPYWSLFGLESQRDERVVHSVAGRLGLTDILHRGMDELSGGQRQRVFVGRALVQEPRAILLDEPDAFLDLRHQIELVRLLQSLAQEHNVGVLMASHDLNLAASGADQLILLDRGAVVSHGTPTRVLDPETIARVYGVTMEALEREPGRPPVLVPAFDPPGLRPPTR